ncbi:alpha/beta hydrolase [Pseudarthrobacter sp. PS3-L1]|uniref:alpha/beta fold hydrolase n=1 Tax=Pseudarthrobacter sp. PS3-L1 TaxID=3046207 RepID=UPI0024BA8C38|nr:alpha/beta hydrolase [Pseudarthrobacter sp. PS3-L1]MDJ0321061.1 alpha/beta hydrolase [Pseudarthrobacter sp. PS3-L1]
MTLTGGRDVESGGVRGKLYSTVSAAQDGSRTAYVLLHGIGVSHRYLERLHRELAVGADVYTFDLPGFGGTPRPRRAFEISDFARFVAGVLRNVGVESFVVVGHSMGTQCAVEVARLIPGQVRGVVLMGPVVESSRRSVALQAAELTRDAMFSESASANRIVFVDYLRAGPRWYFTELPVMMDYALENRLADVVAPVLTLHGEQDPVARRTWCVRLARGARQGMSREIAGHGHVFQHTAAGETAAAITQWAGSLGATSGSSPGA